MADSSGSGGAGNLNDPSNYVRSPPSTLVKVKGTARNDVNGSIGIVVSYDRNRGRYVVSLLPGQGHRSAASAAAAAAAARAAGQASPLVLSLKPENLSEASVVEKVKAQGIAAWSELQRTMADPNIREQIRRAYTSVQMRLPGGVKPEHAGGALLVLWLLCAWTFGFAKAFMTSSLLGLILAVCVQDIAAGASPATTARNFPRRWREAVVQSTGYGRLTETQAMVGFAVLFLLSARVIFAPTPLNRPVGPAALPEVPSQSMPPEPPGHHRRLEDLYRLGFEDGKAGKEYGTSLPDLSESPPLADKPKGPDPAWDPLNPPPGPSSGGGSKFGFGTVMSGFTIFRFVKEAGFTPDGRFDRGLLEANVRNMPPWKLGLIGLCVFNVVRVLF